MLHAYGVVELIDIDAISGNTPIFGRSIKGDLYMTTRIIGVEVYCGDIQETFLFYTDNLVKGGANIMIEVQRRGKLNFHPSQSYNYNLLIFV